MMKALVSTIALSVLMTGCMWRTQVERGMLSTKRMDFNKSYEVDYSNKIKGADRAHGIWLIPLGSPDATDAVKKTVDNANTTSKRKIVGLANTNIKFRFLWLYLYSQRWYTVEGYPIYEKQ